MKTAFTRPITSVKSGIHRITVRLLETPSAMPPMMAPRVKPTLRAEYM